MPSIAQLKEAVDDLEALTSVHAGNDNESGLWRRFALAAEEAAGASTSANETLTGYMLRTALALESVAGTTGAEENVSHQGLLKRIVDALEVQAGAVTTGSLEGRLVVAAANATFFEVLDLAPVVWLEPSDLATVFSDDAGTTPAAVDGVVGRLADKSGNNLHATQAATKPTLRQSGAVYGVEFDAVDDFLVIPDTGDLLDFGQGSFLVAMALRLVASNDFRVLFGKGSNASANHLRFFIQPNERQDIFWGNDVQAYTEANFSVPAASDAVVMWGVDAVGQTAFYSSDATEHAPAVTLSGTGANALAARIGCDTAGNYRTAFTMHGLVVLNTFPSAGERVNLRKYLAGLQGRSP